jgi:hypothetical protein
VKQVGNLSSLTKKSRAETKLHCIYIQKQSIKLARSCFSWGFAFHSTIYELTVFLLKIDRGFFVLGWFFFVIEWLEEVNMATWTWEQMPYTFSYGLLKTVINEETRDMRMKCKLKFILYASNFHPMFLNVYHQLAKFKIQIGVCRHQAYRQGNRGSQCFS